MDVNILYLDEMYSLFLIYLLCLSREEWISLFLKLLSHPTVNPFSIKFKPR